MKSSKIIWQADENGDWQEFDFDNASDCKALVGPIFGEGTVVNENEAMRVLARIVVVYKGGRQETVELLDPFGLVRRNRIVRRVDLSGLQHHILDKCKLIAILCAQATKASAR